MYQRDYILRLIEEFGRFLQIIMGLRGGKQFGEAMDQLRLAGEQLLKIDLTGVPEGDEALRAFITDRGYDTRQTDLLSDMLLLQGELYMELGDPLSAIVSLEQAKFLYRWNDERSKEYSIDRVKKLETVEWHLLRLK